MTVVLLACGTIIVNTLVSRSTTTTTTTTSQQVYSLSKLI
jgi:hypothetical protein